MWLARLSEHLVKVGRHWIEERRFVVRAIGAERANAYRADLAHGIALAKDRQEVRGSVLSKGSASPVHEAR